MIEFRDVTKIYGSNDTHALENVNIKIEDGEFVFIVGSSGAGKSTFLKLIMHEEKPTSGEVIVNGYASTKMKKRQVPYYRRTMGIVFQDFRIIPKMSVYDNVAFAMRVIGTKEKDIRKRVPYILQLVGLSQKARSMPNELSGGEQQRVSIARALAKRPKLLLCDEPTGALDYNTGRQILKLLQETCRKDKMTVVLITHNGAITPMADHIIRMKSGKIVEDIYNENPKNVEEIEW